jgi:hypothetical protein
MRFARLLAPRDTATTVQDDRLEKQSQKRDPKKMSTP